ncbi:unnamed protein product (macronuclear) [Paramecium tetraurelia]|uniref:RING-type domain-containing protein n=1 Tax=Paramecium tetraurelia TaxID=5888 RepID=A0CUZ7_PARTE|nr:uncharacterized protein GSPATT00010782001 [Paramecium tetraurelia]CAK74614.1 unnamed protein product [Paramecium tetraurelia]|eukprot:XP_001442011.1 hypothetical protein (macronuclear) [Paramecium tetraurelia strain d4-2]
MLKFYSFFSIALTVGAVYNSFSAYKQFYPSVLYLSTNKINRTILVNCAIMFISILIMMFLKIMFGKIKDVEKITVIDKTKRKILEVAYLLFFFYVSLDWQFIFLILWLIALSIIHWISKKRAGFLIAESSLNFSDHVKLLMTFIILFYIDIKVANQNYFSQISLYFFYGAEEKFQDLLFSFEFALLPIRMVLPVIKYLMNLFEILTYSQFESKQTVFSALEVLSKILKLIVQIILFQQVLNTQGFLLILLVDIIGNLVALYKKIKAVYNQIKLVRMINRIQDVEKNESHDSTCLICLNELEKGKLLSCGHVFHSSCLKTWISGNQNQFCPKCKSTIKLEETKLQQNDTQDISSKKQILLQELREIRSNIQILKSLNQCRNLQNNVQNTQGIGNLQYALPCEALQFTTGLSEIKRQQMNYMNKIVRAIDQGVIGSHLLTK